MNALNFSNEEYRVISDGDLKYIRFNCFNLFENELNHIFSTRHGGISTGIYKSLNLGIKGSDDLANIEENYRRLLISAGFDKSGVEEHRRIFSNQVHGGRIKTIRKEDISAISSNGLQGYDGLITDIPGIILETFHADCAPVFFFDPVTKAIGIAHSGWKGTLLEISGKLVERMITDFGSQPESIIAAIGPSIGKCCFEAGEEVYGEFACKYTDSMHYERVAPDKWTIDLKGIIVSVLLKAGLKRYNIHDCHICTKCHKDLFFSYRGDSGKTGSLAAFIQLRESK